MSTNECPGLLMSLRGEVVLFTGRAHVDGAHMQRTTLMMHTRRLGGHVARGRSRAVTVLVRGDLGTGRLKDMRRGYSQNLVYAEKVRGHPGHHIHVIEDAGFEALLHGRPARCYEV